ncbi:MAG: hypothetical protein Q9177_000838 [Variospora cf. flavescens]
MHRPMSRSLLLVLHFIADLQLCYAVLPLNPSARGSECSCYRPTGNDAALFLNHQFFDFRSLANETFASNLTPPALIDDAQQGGFEPLTSPFFGKGLLGDFFFPASWNTSASANSPIAMVNSQQNIYLARDTSISPVHLTLRTNRLSRFQSASDLETVEPDFMHASIRIRARVTGSPGACAGIFTYHSDDQESDIEILTSDNDNIIRATNQPGMDPQGKVIPEATTQVVISAPGSEDNGSWTDWNDYQLDWLPGQSQWYVNGVSKLNKTYGVPTEASNIQLKMWSDGGSWTGNMSVGGVATLDIEWIDLVFNTSHDAPGAACTRVCTVDNIAYNAVPQVAGARIGATRVGLMSACALAVFWAGFVIL